MAEPHRVKIHEKCSAELDKMRRKCPDFTAFVAAEIKELLRRLDAGDPTTPPRYKELGHDLAGIAEIRKRRPAYRIYYKTLGEVVWILLCDSNKGGAAISRTVKDELKKRLKDAEEAA